MGKKHYIIPIFVPHEGCPHNCVFCNQNTITGSTAVVDKSYVENIAEQYLKTIDKNDCTVEISFFGGTFTAIKIEKQKELLEVAKRYKTQGKIDYIRLSTRPDYINNEILDNLKEYDVDIIELGVQSLEDDVLKHAGRGHDVETVYRASALIKEYQFTLGHQIMPGLPYDTFEKDIATVKKVLEIKPDLCRIYPALVIKNTPMETMYLNGQYKPYSLDEAVHISKIMYGMLVVNDIKVIRIGLQPTEEINAGKELVAGPFHPAFRELVEGSVFNDMLLEIVPEEYTGNIFVDINSKDISKLFADKKKFFVDILRQLEGCNVKVRQNNDIQIGSIAVEYNQKTYNMSMYKYFSDKFKRGII